MNGVVPISAAARRAQLVVALFCGAALLLRLGITVFDPGPELDPDLLVRLERFVSYFTIQSNFVVMLAAIFVVRGVDLGSPWQRALRLIAMVSITITCIVYIVVLSGDSSNAGLSQVANLMLHYIAPPLAVGVWLVWGPWPGLSLGDIPRALVWPAAWIAYTLVHGAITDWYPYPFIDVVDKGYGRVAINVVAITVFAAVLCLAYVAAARWRLRRTARSTAPAEPAAP